MIKFDEQNWNVRKIYGKSMQVWYGKEDAQRIEDDEKL